MSRYVTEGITRDLMSGKRIALIGQKRGEARGIFMEVAADLPVLGAKRMSVSNGHERIALHRRAW